MTSTTIPAPPTPVRATSRIARSTAVLGLAAATMALSFSGAFFTDTDAVDAAVITTGSLSLTAPATVDFTLTNMAPGDTSNRTISLTNGGSLQLRYDMATTAVNSDATFPLSTQLTSIVYLESQEPDTAGANLTCDATYATAATYTALSTGSLGAAALTNRVVAASGTEVLCVAVQLPSATGNDYQSDTTDVTFTFNSEQTANQA